MSITKTVNKVALGEEPKDVHYWRTRPHEERLAALEEMRREYHLWEYGTEPRLQRVCRIICLSEK